MADDWDDDDDWGEDGDGGAGWGSDDDLGFDGAETMSGAVKVENQFVDAEEQHRLFKKATGQDKNRLGEAAISSYRDCIRIEEQETPDAVEFRVKSSSIILQIICTLNKQDDIEPAFQEYFTWYRPGVAKEFFDQLSTITSVLDRVDSVDVRVHMYDLILQRLEPMSESEWHRYATRFCKVYLAMGALDQVHDFLTKMHDKCRLPNGEDDQSKGDQLLKIYAIEIQVATARGDEVGLNDLFKKTERLTTAISDSAAMSVIQECYGKMFSSRNQWERAYNEFFAAFRHALESINAGGEANACLRYVILASMLSNESVNPFASQEARSLESHPSITGTAALLYAFEGDDIRKFESVLFKHKSVILADDFLAFHMPAVKVRLRSRVLVKLIKPYRRVRLDWLGRQLNANDEEVEQLVVNCILNGSVKGRVDQINSVLDLEFGVTKADDLYAAIEQWMGSVKKMQSNLASRSTRGIGGGMGGWSEFDDEDFPLFQTDMFGSMLGDFS